MIRNRGERARTHDEEGATTVMVALLALVLFGAGALAVDIGHVYAKRSALQSNVDHAVLAAAAELTQEDGCNQEVKDTATEYLQKAANETPDQAAVDLGGSASDDDGFIRCIDWRVDLWAPKAHVSYGMARAVTDSEGVDVPAFAAAQIKSAGTSSSLPMFAVDGCDYGRQIIRDDSGPADPPPTPPLTPDSGTYNNATLTSVSPDITPLGTASLEVTISGNNLDDVTEVGFTGAGGPPDHFEVAEGDFVSASNTAISVNVPSDVLNLDDVWYVRVKKGTDWSNPDHAQRFTVGEPRLYCAESVEGNFGTLRIPRTDDGSSKELVFNIIRGIQPTLAIHPSPNGECGGDPSPTVEADDGDETGVNCLATEPGLKMSQGTDGFVKGASGPGDNPGRLDADTTPGCSRNGDSDRTATALKGKYLNDDVLTCFIVNDARIQDLVQGNAKGTKALSGDIFSSPRFFQIPVVEAEPTNGTKSWPIVDFRAGFITDQQLSATNAFPGSVSEFNGLDAAPSGLRQLNVILFDDAALPEAAPAVGGELEYKGSGTKVIVLVD